MTPAYSAPYKTLQNRLKIQTAIRRTLLRNRAYGTIQVASDCLRQIVLGIIMKAKQS